MIHVYFERKDDIKAICLSVSGHAGQADKGKDIVCAAASILAYTLAQNLIADRRVGLYECVEIEMVGSAYIFCRAKDGDYDHARHTYEVIRKGYELLAGDYPQYVKLNQFGKA